MQDYYLRATSEAAMDAALEASGLTVDGQPTAGVAIDRIGIISREPVIETLTGWHANVRLLFDPTPEQLAELDAVSIAEPSTPFRVWA